MLSITALIRTRNSSRLKGAFLFHAQCSGWLSRPLKFLVIYSANRNDTLAHLSDHHQLQKSGECIAYQDMLCLVNLHSFAVADACVDYSIFIDSRETICSDWLTNSERLIDSHAPDISFHRVVFGFRKNVCETVGGFDLMLGREVGDNANGVEVDFDRRLLTEGFSVWRTPDAVIHHRIQDIKPKRSYFIDLHYKHGRGDGTRSHRTESRWPPIYIYGQLWRAFSVALRQALSQGRDTSLRKEMNVAYFIGTLSGWIRPRDAGR